MLRDLSLVELSVLAGVCAQCGDEAAKISIASNLPEAACDLQDSGSDPALEHCAVTPALDVAHVVHDQAVEVLNRVGTSQRVVQRSIDAKTRERENLFQPVLERARGGGMDTLERTGQALELSLGQIRI